MAVAVATTAPPHPNQQKTKACSGFSNSSNSSNSSNIRSKVKVATAAITAAA